MAASIRNLTGCLVEIFIAFPDEIGNSKTFEANLQNSRGCLVESYWMSSRIYWTSNRNFTGCPVKYFMAFLDEIGNSKTSSRI